MAIVLVTGLPGHGKTLYSLVRWKRLAEDEKRPVFHNSIPGLTLDWQVHDPLRWFDLPPSSVMVIDEAQRVFPVRPRGGEVPEHYRQLETHRHGGLDLVVITQHPTLIDSHVRKLCDRHFHVVRRFGTSSVVVYENPSGVSDYPEKVKRRTGIITHEWKLDRRAFAWYKSAEVHTVKRRLPARFYVLVGAAVVAPVLLWFAYARLHTRVATGDASASPAPGANVRPGGSASPPPGSGGGGGRGGSAAPAHLTRAAYLAQFEPRVPGALYTAPVYDGMTQPVEAPYPAVCMHVEGRPCQCWNQRGFRYPLDQGSCLRYAVEPFDAYWRRRPWQERQAGAPLPQSQDAPGGPSVGSPAPSPAVGASAPGLVAMQ